MAEGSPWTAVHAFLTARTGMSLSGAQVRRLDEKLAARCQGLTPHQYLLFLKSPAGAADLEELIAAVVVNKTDLFRDEVQLSAFRSHVLAPLVERTRRPLRVWSAGCATGEEVATLLVLLAEAGADPGSTVLGTDISAAALQRAQALGFTGEQLRRVPAGTRERYFTGAGTRLTLSRALRERASFQVHNLMDRPYPVPMGSAGFDVIFCRNVLIYFTPEAFQQTVEALAASLAPGGTLVLSSSEPLLDVPPSLQVLRGEQAFFYVRADAEAPRKPDTGRFPAVAAERAPMERKRDTGRFAAVKSPEAPVRNSGQFAAVPAGQVPSPPARDSGRIPAVPQPPTRDSGRTPAVAPPPAAPSRDSGRFAAVPPPAAAPPDFAGADLLFACVLDGAASGVPDEVSERDLRRCLELDPDHAAARYLLGLLLEQCGRLAEAAAEYRRALQSLEDGRARPVPFFLNPARLRMACAHAAERLDAGGRSR